jgi:hypothetical protein
MDSSSKSPTPNHATLATIDIQSVMQEGTWFIYELTDKDDSKSITYQALSSSSLEIWARKSQSKIDCLMLHHIELANGLAHTDEIILPAKYFTTLANLYLKQRQKK